MKYTFDDSDFTTRLSLTGSLTDSLFPVSFASKNEKAPIALVTYRHHKCIYVLSSIYFPFILSSATRSTSAKRDNDNYDYVKMVGVMRDSHSAFCVVQCASVRMFDRREFVFLKETKISIGILIFHWTFRTFTSNVM